MVSIDALAFRPPAGREGDERFVPLAAELGARFAPASAAHDPENRATAPATCSPLERACRDVRATR